MDGTTGVILVLVGLCTVVSVAAHWWIRSYGGACLAAALASTALMQVITWVELGHFDKFLPIAVVVGAIWGLAVAVPVGWLVRLIRSRWGRR
jgi:MFS superfamily sulfate permease-like transporter